MRKIINTKFSLAIILFMVALAGGVMVYGLSQKPQPVYAGTGHNVSGYAWSGNYGWVSFNSTSDSSPVDYGVAINPTTGVFSGYAWSENIGWIYFGPNTDTSYLYGEITISNDAPEFPKQWAKWNSTTGEITGWAKILALGDGGWLKFDNSPTSTVSIDASGNFRGLAWNGNADGTGLGWLVFNCIDESAGCSGHDYKVSALLNQAPDIQNPASQTAVNACATTGSVKNTILSWDYHDDDGDVQIESQIQISDTPSFASPFVDTTVPNSVNQYSIIIGDYDYGATYYWQARVKDSKGAYSGWTSMQNFSIPDHEYPDVDFTFTPSDPSQNQEITFTSISEYYDALDPGTPVPCDSTNCIYSWSFGPSCGKNPVSGGLTDPSLTVTFTNKVNCGVTLDVSDGSFACSINRPVDVKVGLPKWKEVK